MSVPDKPTVLFIVGATASGKTDAALAVVEALRVCGHSAEIINADSRQVYRGMSIGTAKPAPDELSRARHHLVDVADPADGFSLATFLRLARAAIDDIVARNATPIIVGGTGQYVWGLAEGWQAPEVAPNSDIRARLESEGAAALFQRLQEIDPEAAALMDPNNTRRLVRALEVIEITGRSFSEQRTKQPPQFTPHMLALSVPREQLYARIDARVDAMITGGWVGEVEALLASGATADLPAFSSAGYREVAAYLAGAMTLQEAATKAKTATHRLARSQANWFASTDQRISWHTTRESLVAEAAGVCCP
jgi:tRNA dimethylallyltransferase